MLSKEQILGSDDVVFEEVEVPEWGGTVRLRVMSGAERDSIESKFTHKDPALKEKAYANLRARMAAVTICDAEGKRIFEPKDAAALGEKSAAALDRVFAVAKRMNGFSDEDVKELVGESGRDQS